MWGGGMRDVRTQGIPGLVFENGSIFTQTTYRCIYAVNIVNIVTKYKSNCSGCLFADMKTKHSEKSDKTYLSNRNSLSKQYTQFGMFINANMKKTNP